MHQYRHAITNAMIHARHGACCGIEKHLRSHTIFFRPLKKNFALEGENFQAVRISMCLGIPMPEGSKGGPWTLQVLPDELRCASMSCGECNGVTYL
eukprot:1159652-Pelagomonas_calceolata.AAC.11